MNARESMGGPIGELTILDATLCELLVDILRTFHEYAGIEFETIGNLDRATTGQTTDELLRIAKLRHDLVSPDTRAWLKRVKSAAETRNDVVHALGLDRCVECGLATRFGSRNKEIDRSPDAVAALCERFAQLIREGVVLALDMSHRLNKYLRDVMQKIVDESKTPGSPTQVLIGQMLCRCASCSETGLAQTIARMPTAVALFPKGRSNAERVALLRALGVTGAIDDLDTEASDGQTPD